MQISEENGLVPPKYHRDTISIDLCSVSYLVCAVLAPGQLLPCPKEAIKISAVVFSCAMLPSPHKEAVADL